MKGQQRRQRLRPEQGQVGAQDEHVLVFEFIEQSLGRQNGACGSLQHFLVDSFDVSGSQLFDDSLLLIAHDEKNLFRFHLEDRVPHEPEHGFPQQGMEDFVFVRLEPGSLPRGQDKSQEIFFHVIRVMSLNFLSSQTGSKSVSFWARIRKYLSI
jgi:hypothetical protein